MLRHVYFLMALILFGLGQSAYAQSSPQPCGESIVNLVVKHLAATTPKDIIQPEAIVASACKVWPKNNSITISAFAYRSGLYPEGPDLPKLKGLILVLIDNQNSQIIAAYRDSIEEGADMIVAENSLRIDTARYDLAPSVRAFGLDVVSGSNPYIHIYSGPMRTLFIQDGKSIRPMTTFDINPSSLIQGCDPASSYANPCEESEEKEGETVIENISYGIGISKAVTNGYANLLITATISYSSGEKPREKPFQYELHYDGKKYLADSQSSAALVKWQNDSRPDKWKKKGITQPFPGQN